MTQEKKLPQGRLGRFARVAGLGVRTGARLLTRNHAGAAQHAAEVLGTMRGLAAKVGQMASYIDGMVPEAQRDTYETALRSLRAAAPSSSPAAIRAVVEQELGAPMAELFAHWDDAPMASASIGQVHRAVLADGREVAVKVQHPGIERALESDLDNAGMLESMASTFLPRAIDSKQVLGEIKAHFREELDYRLEAERQQQFIRLHAGDPDISIPAVITERSARRVLTTELVRGTTLEDASTAAEPLRRHYAETLWRFVFKGNLVGAMFNADPHPGNYLFAPGGRIHFLDFGCIQLIAPERLAIARDLHRAALRKDEATFAACATAMLQTRGGLFADQVHAYMRRCFTPVVEAPYRITRPFVAELLLEFKALARLAFRKDSQFVPLPPGMIFMNRLQFGFYSVLARLDVEADYRAVEERFLAEASLLRAT